MRNITMNEEIYSFIKLLLENDKVQEIGRLIESPNGEELTSAYELFHKKGKCMISKEDD